jgi:hypothetical protein
MKALKAAFADALLGADLGGGLKSRAATLAAVSPDSVSLSGVENSRPKWRQVFTHSWAVVLSLATVALACDSTASKLAFVQSAILGARPLQKGEPLQRPASGGFHASMLPE